MSIFADRSLDQRLLSIAEQGLSQVSNGKVIVALKTPSDDGTSQSASQQGLLGDVGAATEAGLCSRNREL